MHTSFNVNNLNKYHKYYVYILTNKYRTTFYIGVTNDLKRRLTEHISGVNNKSKSFTARYFLTDLIYFEHFSWIQDAIAREKELKGWRKDKKLALIRLSNPMLITLEI